MRYSEIFRTIQGEGQFVGYPTIFFRTSYCNLRCAWGPNNYCDTPYTSWHPENKEINVSEATKKITELGKGCNHVVITGGEPFLFTDELADLCSNLKTKNKIITIETNSTIYHEVDVDLISMSPKLSSSTPTETQSAKWHFKHEKERIKPDVIRKFIENYSVQVKFVIADLDKDIQEIKQLEKDIPIPKEKIILMPEGITRDDIRWKQAKIADYCIKEGYRYSDRLHVQIWGNRRGT